MNTNEQQLRAQIATLAEKFVERTRGQLIRMSEQLPRVIEGDPAARQVIQELAHMIHGSGALFGFESVSERAEELEHLAVEIATGAGAVDQLKARLDRLIETFEATAPASPITPDQTAPLK